MTSQASHNRLSLCCAQLGLRETIRGRVEAGACNTFLTTRFFRRLPSTRIGRRRWGSGQKARRGRTAASICGGLARARWRLGPIGNPVWAQRSSQSTAPTTLVGGRGSLALSQLLFPAPRGNAAATGGFRTWDGTQGTCHSLDWDRRPRSQLLACCATHPHDNWGSEAPLSTHSSTASLCEPREAHKPTGCAEWGPGHLAGSIWGRTHCCVGGGWHPICPTCDSTEDSDEARKQTS